MDPSNQTVMLIAGGFSLAISIILLLCYRRANMLANEMWVADTYNAVDLRRLCSGDFNAVVEVRGKVTCDKPAAAPLTGFPCCWARTRIEREEQRLYGTRDSGDKEIWVKDSDMITTAIFKINDDTGYTLIDPTGADIEAEKPEAIILDVRPDWFGGAVGWSATGRYRVTEEVFLPQGEAYVLGQASTCGEGTSDDALIHYPGEGILDPRQKFFIISRKTEEQLAKEADKSVKLSLYAGVVGLVFGIYCLLCALKLVS